MVFSRLEQKYLKEMLIAERLKKEFEPKKTAYFYKTMNVLKDNDCIEIIDGKRKNFKLTIFGKAMASIFLKHPKANPKKKQYAYDVELFLWSFIK